METCQTCHYFKLRRSFNSCSHSNCNELHCDHPKEVQECQVRHPFYCAHPEVCGRIAEDTPACSFYEHESLTLQR